MRETTVANEQEMERFFEGLVEHGLVVPTRVPGTFARGPVFEDVIASFDRYVLRAVGGGVESLAFPPVMDRTIMERTDYLDSFPHLAGAVFSFFGTDREARELAATVREGKPWADRLGVTEICLCPAICHPLYPVIAGELPAGGRQFSLIGWAFRHEPSPEPTRLQAFRMRELVRAGSPDDVVAWRDEWLGRGLGLLRALELPVDSDVANDPFFGRAGKMLASSQREQRLKFELLVPVISDESPTAVCSFNYHQDHFGSVFGIRTMDGAVAHTACFGFGLERVAMALFKTHGFDPREWPEGVRGVLWS